MNMRKINFRVIGAAIVFASAIGCAAMSPILAHTSNAQKQTSHLKSEQHRDFLSKRRDIRHYGTKMHARQVADRDTYHHQVTSLRKQELQWRSAHGNRITPAERARVKAEQANFYREDMNDKHRASYDAAQNRKKMNRRYEQQRANIKAKPRH